MKRWPKVGWAVALIALMIGVVSVARAEDEGKSNKQDKRAKIDAMADDALKELLAESPGAKKNFDKAYGYAVFDNLKIQFILSGGGGAGVAVNKGTGARTYMKMGTGGVGLGLGGEKYQVIFLMENEKAFNRFVNEGWHADTGARAAAGTAGAAAEATFTNGVVIYQITDKGLLASVDITGTKYWKWKKLNK